MSLDHVNYQAALDAMTDDDLDALDYGVVKMDLTGKVTAYNTVEAEFSGISKDRVIGRNFFVEVAPCTNNFMIAQKYHDNDVLDQQIDYIFTLKMRPTPVKLHLLKQSEAGSMYLVVNRA